MDDLLSDFRGESAEGLELTEQSLLAYENGEKSAIHEAFRALHTIKGGSGFLELDGVNRLAHQMENLLDQIRQGERQTTAFTTDLLLRGVDRLRVMLDSDDLGESMGNEDLLTDLARSLDGEDLVAPSGARRHAISVVETTPPPPVPSAPATTPPVAAVSSGSGPQRHFGAFLVESGQITCDQLLDALFQQEALALPGVILLNDAVGLPPPVCLELARTAREQGVDVIAWAADQGHIDHELASSLLQRRRQSRPPLGQVLTSMDILERSEVVHLLGAYHEHRHAYAAQGA